MKKYNFLTWDAVLASIGHGGLKEGQVVNRLQEEYKKKKRRRSQRNRLLTRSTHQAEAKVTSMPRVVL